MHILPHSPNTHRRRWTSPTRTSSTATSQTRRWAPRPTTLCWTGEGGCIELLYAAGVCLGWTKGMAAWF